MYCTLHFHTPVQQTCSHFIHYSVMIDWLMFNTNFSSISALLWLHYSVMSITLLPYTRHCPILYSISVRSSISIYATTVPLYTIICHLQLSVQTVPITTNIVSSNPVHGKVYSIQHYVIKFASDLRQVGGFLRVIRFPQPIKLTATI